jgi:hypothetical protein
MDFDTTTTTIAPGASRQRWKSKSASALIKELIDKHGGDVDDEVCRRDAFDDLREMMFDDEAARAKYLNSILDYFFTNAVNAIRRAKAKKAPRPSAAPPEAQQDASEQAPSEPAWVPTPQEALTETLAKAASQETPQTSTTPEGAPEASSGVTQTPPEVERSSETLFEAPAEPVAAEAAMARAAAAAQRADEQRVVREAAHVDIKRKLKFKYLALIMPNGKLLGECTGAECRELAPRMGLWLNRIADRVAPTELVGTVLDEATLGGLYEAAA